MTIYPFTDPVAALRGIYLGPEVGIWELLWALSIYYVGTWTLWVRVDPTPSKCRSGEPGIRDLGFAISFPTPS